MLQSTDAGLRHRVRLRRPHAAARSARGLRRARLAGGAGRHGARRDRLLEIDGVDAVNGSQPTSTASTRRWRRRRPARRTASSCARRRQPCDGRPHVGQRRRARRCRTCSTIATPSGTRRLPAVQRPHRDGRGAAGRRGERSSRPLASATWCSTCATTAAACWTIASELAYMVAPAAATAGHDLRAAAASTARTRSAWRRRRPSLPFYATARGFSVTAGQAAAAARPVARHRADRPRHLLGQRVGGQRPARRRRHGRSGRRRHLRQALRLLSRRTTAAPPTSRSSSRASTSRASATTATASRRPAPWPTTSATRWAMPPKRGWRRRCSYRSSGACPATASSEQAGDAACRRPRRPARRTWTAAPCARSRIVRPVDLSN